MRDSHEGQRCVLIGNGPSVNNTDLESLRGEQIVTLNRAFLLFDKLPTRPAYHVVVNRLVAEQSKDELAAFPGPLFATWGNRQNLARCADVVFLHQSGRKEFSQDPRRGIYEGHTVTFVAMQLAFWLGFEKVILIGVDHRFAVTGTPNATVVSDGPDASHFDPAYFGPGFRWQLPDLENSERAYRMADAVFTSHGREIVDCTVGGALAVFRRSTIQRELI